MTHELVHWMGKYGLGDFGLDFKICTESHKIYNIVIVFFSSIAELL